MRKRSVKMTAVGIAAALLVSGCGSIEQFLVKEEASAPEPVPVESSVPEEPIDPEEQARLDLLNTLEDISIPTTTQTNRKDYSGPAAASREYGLASGREDSDDSSMPEDEGDALIPGAWLTDDETMQELISEDGHIRIKVPLAWRDLTGQLTRDDEVNQSFNLQLGDTDQAEFFMANSESRRYSPFMSLDEYSSAIVAAVFNTMNSSGDFQEAELFETVDLTSEVHDFVIRKSTLRAVYAGNPVMYYIYAVQGGYRYFQFNCWTAEAQKDVAEPVFDKIVCGFIEE